MKTVYVLFMDVDGTMSKGGIVDANEFRDFISTIKAIETRDDVEIHVVLASGRPAPYLQGIQVFCSELKKPFIIAENGSILVVNYAQGFDYEMLMPQQHRDIMFAVKAKLRSISEIEGFEFTVERGKEYSISVKWPEKYNSIKFFEVFERFMAEFFDPHTLKQISWAFTSDSIDVFGASTSKRSGVQEVLRRYAQYQEIDVDRVLYAGDSHNDMEAAELVRKHDKGVVIVPENAVGDLKDIAAIVGKGVALKGVVNALKQYFNI
ncbi:MAG: HAD family hydrolase [Ignavibacteriales bacterium]